MTLAEKLPRLLNVDFQSFFEVLAGLCQFVLIACEYIFYLLIFS